MQELAEKIEPVERAILRTPITDRSAWMGHELAGDTAWRHQLTKEEVDDLENALSVARDKGVRHEDVTTEDFPLPVLRPTLDRLQREVDNDRGVFLLKGVPVQNRSIEEIEVMYAGIAAHLGRRIVQDTSGTLIDHVYNRGASYESIAVRGYTTNAHLTPHCDSGDLVVLLCVRPAKSGGLNLLSSSTTIYNKILENHPEYLEALYNGFHYNIRGNGPPGPFQNITGHRVPIYSYHDGKLSCRYNQKAILTAEQLEGVEPLTDLEKAAINYVAEVANDPEVRAEVQLEAGDIVFLNNHYVLHNRTGFEDYEDPDQRRLLLRLWLNLDQARELTWEFADHYNTGPREGPHVHTSPVGERNR
jgi:hypothetical protein